MDLVTRVAELVRLGGHTSLYHTILLNLQKGSLCSQTIQSGISICSTNHHPRRQHKLLPRRTIVLPGTMTNGE